MVSNRTLALFIIATVIVSLGGTLMSLNKLEELQSLKTPVKVRAAPTGYASGIVALNITTSADCVVNTNVSFGAASKPAITTTISTDLNNGAAGFASCQDAATEMNCTGMHINNTGNVNINVTYFSTANASDFIGSQTNLDSYDFVYYLKNGTYTGGNSGCRIMNNTNGTVLKTSTLICQNLSFSDGNDIMTMEYNVTIEPDVSAGAKTATITIACAQNN